MTAFAEKPPLNSGFSQTLFGKLQIFTTTSSYLCKNVKNVVAAFETVYRILRAESPDSRPARDNARTDNRTYTIAKKHIIGKAEIVALIFAFVILVLAFVLDFFLLSGEGETDIIACISLIIILAAVLAVCLIYLISYLKTPTDLIIRQSEFLIFKGMTFKISDVRFLNYRQMTAAYSNLNRGTVILSANGKKYRLRFADDVAKAANDLSRLTLQYSSVKKG